MKTLHRTDLVRIVGRKEAGEHLYVIRKAETDDFTGVQRISAHPLLPRLYTGRDGPPRDQLSLLLEELTRLPSPAEALEQALPLRQDAWPTRTRQSIERLFALWLLHEDRKRLLDAAAIDQLAHQVSLLEYIKYNDIRRLLLADEVGLGKTIEAGLIIQWVLQNNPSARILYLAPAMLVDNVYGELKRMEISARIDRYSSSISSISNANLRDAQVIVASVHRAAFERNVEHWRESSGAWDLLIVDECHHAADWSADGSSPKKQMRLVRDLVEQRLKPEGRLVLMSATPHQGNENKFRNLLRLLSEEGYRSASGSLESVAGRVIYRTKEDVRDWDGEPLFSKRQVNAPTYVQLGPAYHEWLAHVADVFVDAGQGPAAWRKAQALQWAASSPKAGLSYLARLALRCGFDFDRDPVLWDVARVLRPYRGLAADAPVEAVRALLEKQATVGRSSSDEDQDTDIDTESPVDSEALLAALRSGLELMQSDAMQTKMDPLLRWVEEEAPAKFVVFASPIETVDELKLGLEHLLGDGAVVCITGSLKPHERRAQMLAFRGEGVRVLVASKAGSEGINLQVSHRLVHFDVPWNPMEMEQRVGRVHRYGSTQTVVVDTIVASGSREERMLRRCRARLAQIVEQLFGPEAREGSRFEEMYSRVMTQVSAEELAEIVAEEGFLTMTGDGLDKLVQAGFEGWRASDEALRKGTDDAVEEIPDRGHARESDMEALFPLLGAERESGWHHVRLVERSGERVEETTPASVWLFPAEGSNVRRVADRTSSLGVRGAAGFQGFVERAGLNLPSVAAKLRELVGGTHPQVGRSPRAIGFNDGAGTVRLPKADWIGWLKGSDFPSASWDRGGILLAWGLRLLHRGTATEAWTGIKIRMMKPDRSDGRWLDAAEGAELLRLLWQNRRSQTLILPPHRRADASGFDLTGLSSDAARLAPEVLKGPGSFSPDRHDFEIVPIAAFTIEPRGEVGQDDIDAPGDGDECAFSAIDATYCPSSDLLERILLTIDEIPDSPNTGDSSLYVLLVVEPSRLESPLRTDNESAFGVYIGSADHHVIEGCKKGGDSTDLVRTSPLLWDSLAPVGVLNLGARFQRISSDDAESLKCTLATALRQHGVRIFDSH